MRDPDLDYFDDYADPGTDSVQGYDDYDLSLTGDYDDVNLDYDDGFSPPRRKRRPFWPWIAGAGAILLVIGVGVIWLVLRSPQDAQKPDTTDIAGVGTPSASLAPSSPPSAEALTPPAATELPLAPSAPSLSSGAHYQYDANGKITERLAPDGQITRYEYDAANRLTAIHYPDGSQVLYTYDEMGRRTQMVDQLGTTTYDYDLLGRLTDVTDPHGNHVGYEYSSRGSLTALIYPDGSVVRYDHDADGNLVGVTDDIGSTTYTYDQAGRLTGRMLPNGVTTSYSFDDANRLVGIVHADSAGQILLAFEYTLDARGNRTQMVQITAAGNRLVTDYHYDPLSRLVGVTYPEGREVGYTYDAVGNRTTMIAPEGTTHYSYDSLDQLISLTEPDGSVTTFHYDANGNLVERLEPRRTTLYGYDFENRLVKVDDGQTISEFAYDGDGRRLVKVVDGEVTQYVQHGSLLPQVLLESSNGLAVSSLFGLLRIGETDSRGTVFHLQDGLGSVVGVTDTAGDLLGLTGYDAFGVAHDPQSIVSRFGFTGEQYDPSTDLLFLRARYYAPALGRFVSADPFPGHIVQPQTANPYAYARNNPTNLVDPSGLDAGDVYLYLGDNNWVQWLIALATWGPYGHASIDLGNGFMLTARPGKGVFLEPVSNLHGKSYDVYRPTVSVDASRLQQVAQNIVGQSGGWLGGYDYSGVLLGLNPGRLFTNTEYEGYCSSVVARALREVGVSGVPRERWFGRISPNALSKISGLQKIASVSPESGPSIRFYDDDDNDWRRGVFLPPPPPPGSAGVGGVSLDRAAEVLVNLTDVTGATYDSTTGQLILIGQQDQRLPPMRMDDLVVAIRSVYSGEDPGVTMVPVDPSGQEITQRVEYFGQVESTYFGWVMFEADRYLKGLAAGKDTLTGESVEPDVPGFKSELQLSFEQRTETPWHRNWFVPHEIVLRESVDGQTMIFDRAAIKLESRFIKFLEDGSHVDVAGSSPVTDRFTAFVTEHYDGFAAEKPELAELVRLAKIVGVVKWLRDNDIPVDLSWLEDYQVAYVETPLTTPGVKAEMSTPDGMYTTYSFGGVDLSTENTYTEDETGEAVALRELALLHRPDNAPLAWTFEQDGETYHAVALNLAPAEIVGGQTFAVTDLVVPAMGGTSPSLTRYYSSLNQADGPMGPGWSVVPYSLSIQEKAVPVGDSEYQIEQIAHLTSGTRSESFAGPYLTGAGEKVLLPDTAGSAYRDVVLQPDGVSVVRRRDGLQIVFDAEGRLQFTTDRNGNSLVYRYDDSHPERLVAIVGENDAGITLQYTKDSWLSDALASNGSARHYTHDDAGRLAGVADDAGPLAHYLYDDNDLLIEIRDGENRTLLRNTYDGLGRLLAQVDGNGYQVSTTYDSSSGQVTSTDAEGRQVTRQYREGLLRSWTDPLGHETAFGYNPDGSLVSVTDPRGHTTSYGYDQSGNLVSAETPQGERTRMWYNNEGRVEMAITPDGMLTLYEYKGAGNPTLVTSGLVVTSLDGEGNISYSSADAYSMGFGYDLFGNLSAITDAAGYTTHMGYDELGNMTSAELPGGGIVQQAYDDRGWPTSILDPLGHRVQFEYDARGNPTMVKTPVGVIEYEYDTLGNLTGIIDPLGNAIRYGYDVMGNLVRVTEADGAVTKYEYDNRGYLVRVIDANGHATVYEYDARGQLIHEKPGD